MLFKTLRRNSTYMLKKKSTIFAKHFSLNHAIPHTFKTMALWQFEVHVDPTYYNCGNTWQSHSAIGTMACWRVCTEGTEEEMFALLPIFNMHHILISYCYFLLRSSQKSFMLPQCSARNEHYQTLHFWSLL